MLFSLKFQPHPFRFLVHTEWVMLASCGSLAILEAITGRRLPLQHISVLALLCLMGWMLPTGKSPIKILYTVAEIGLIFYGTMLGYLHILPTLYLIVFIRSCFLFGTSGRWAVAGLLFVLFLVHQIHYVQKNRIWTARDAGANRCTGRHVYPGDRTGKGVSNWGGSTPDN